MPPTLPPYDLVDSGLRYIVLNGKLPACGACCRAYGKYLVVGKLRASIGGALAGSAVSDTISAIGLWRLPFQIAQPAISLVAILVRAFAPLRSRPTERSEYQVVYENRTP